MARGNYVLLNVRTIGNTEYSNLFTYYFYYTNIKFDSLNRMANRINIVITFDNISVFIYETQINLILVGTYIHLST